MASLHETKLVQLPTITLNALWDEPPSTGTGVREHCQKSCFFRTAEAS